jgi:hypothetical protein
MGNKLLRFILPFLIGASAIVPSKAEMLMTVGANKNDMTEKSALSLDMSFNNKPYFHIGAGQDETEIFSDYNFKQESFEINPVIYAEMGSNKTDNAEDKSKNIVGGLENSINLSDSFKLNFSLFSSNDENENNSTDKSTSVENFQGTDYNYDVTVNADTKTNVKAINTFNAGHLGIGYDDFELTGIYNIGETAISGTVDTTIESILDGTVSNVPVHTRSVNSTSTPISEKQAFSRNAVAATYHINSDSLAGTIDAISDGNILSARIAIPIDKYETDMDKIKDIEKQISKIYKSEGYSNILDNRIRQLEREEEGTVILSADTKGNGKISYNSRDIRVGAMQQNNVTSATLGYKSFDITASAKKLNLSYTSKF